MINVLSVVLYDIGYLCIERPGIPVQVVIVVLLDVFASIMCYVSGFVVLLRCGVVMI